MIAKFIAFTLTLFFVIGAFGHVPIYLSLMSKVSPQRRHMVWFRELFFALLIMIAFHYMGLLLLSAMNISSATVYIAGGIVLFLIALRLIFKDDEIKPTWGQKEPFIVPLATPLLAGPSVLAVIMIYSQEFTSHRLLILLSLFAAWIASALVFFFAKPLMNLLKEKGLLAIQRLMGLIITMLAVQSIITGIGKI